MFTKKIISSMGRPYTRFNLVQVIKVSDSVRESLVSEPGSLPLPQAAPVVQHLPLHLSQSLTSGSWSCCQLLVFPRSMVRYSWWRRSLGIIFMCPNCTHGIFDPWSCTWTLWIGDKVLFNTCLHSPHICDVPAPEFPLDCCQAAVRACTVILVRSRSRISGLWAI